MGEARVAELEMAIQGAYNINKALQASLSKAKLWCNKQEQACQRRKKQAKLDSEEKAILKQALVNILSYSYNKTTDACFSLSGCGVVAKEALEEIGYLPHND